jgi:arabinofuranosyltransferase
LLLGGLLLFAAVDFRRDFKERFNALLAAVGLAILVLFPLVLFRWFYFHQWVPNTFYAKIGGIDKEDLIRLGTQYFGSFLKTPPFLGPLALGAAIYAARKREFGIQNMALWGFILIAVLSVIVSGGDHMIAFRFCVPLVPLFTVVLIVHLHDTGLLSNLRFTCVFTAFLLVLLAMQVRSIPLNPKVMDPAAQVGEEIGRYIHQYWASHSVVALNTAGSTPYYADEMQFIDMLGLNDSIIARRKDIPEFGPWTHKVGHLKGDGASVLSRRPDYIILGPAEGTTPQLRKKVYFIGDYEIGISPSFKADYEVCVVTLVDGTPFTFFQRRDTHQSCPK